MEKQKVYAKIPKFDEATQYIVQLAPIETDETIYYGVEVKDIENTTENGFVETYESEPYVAQPEPEHIPTLEERTAELETATQQQAMTLDEVVTILEAIV